MKGTHFLLLLVCSSPLHPAGFLQKSTGFYNSLLNDQTAIEKINQHRPKIYIYTDFGGGKNAGKALADLQTSGELASAAWKETLQQELYINDSAKPLSPERAAQHLAATFPYEAKQRKAHTIVVHVVDPGVGNAEETHPRCIVLRKDGTVFIGPDNGSLTLACPPGSIEGIWEIDAKELNRLSGIDTKAGGTFHGRDLFCEAAFRIAAGLLSFDEIGIRYEENELKKRFDLKPSHLAPLTFRTLHTERFIFENSNNLFDQTFLLGVIQSSLYSEEGTLTEAKKFFIAKPSKEDSLAIVNHQTGNVFIGPNNGLGTSFFKDYPEENVEVHVLSSKAVNAVCEEKNNEAAYALIEKQPKFDLPLETVEYIGQLLRDKHGRLKTLRAKIWIDLYGNIKTTMTSDLLNEAKRTGARVEVSLNGVQQPVIFADTFFQVPKDQLFIYNGSTGTIGPNPHRSKRYVELTANGIYGKFGTDFFIYNGKIPVSGQEITFHFKY